MLRHAALSAAHTRRHGRNNGAGSSQAISSRGRRYRSGNPQIKNECQANEPVRNRSESSSLPSSGARRYNRPSFLQKLSVRKNPISQVSLGKDRNAFNKNIEKPGPASNLSEALRGRNKLSNLKLNLTNRESLNPKSATKSNLQNTPDKGEPDLVEFFAKRLEMAKKSAAEIDRQIAVPRARSASNSHLRTQVQQPPRFASITSLYNSNEGRSNHNNSNNKIPKSLPQRQVTRPESDRVNFQAVGNEARIAQERPRYGIASEATSAATKPDTRSSIRGLLEQARSTGSPAFKEEANEATKSHESPIKQFITELQKKKRMHNQQQNQQSRQGTEKEQTLPSWRKSAQEFSRGNQFNSHKLHQQSVSLDALFSSSNNQLQPGAVSEKLLTKEEEMNAKAQEYLDHLHTNMKEPKGSNEVSKPKIVTLPSEDATIRELSALFGEKISKVMQCLENLGELPKDEDSYRIDADTAEMLAMELNIEFKRLARRAKKFDYGHKQLMERRKVSEEAGQSNPDGKGDVGEEIKVYETLPLRPPVVCIMGHVDHGKTTLMDALRRRAQSGGRKSQQKKFKKGKKGSKKSSKESGDVAGTEAGGITQIISAFEVPLADNQESITFLDTPGHAAFSAMRQFGSHAADIVVLVVAADDGVSTQTIEIINFYKSIVQDSNGGISMVVAMNKIDKPGIDVQESRSRIENQLLEHEIVPEGISSQSEYGSPVQFFPISAKTGEGLDDLIEGLALQSEVMDLRADNEARAEGIVMDARVEQGLGVVVDCIVRWGSIKKGDVVVSGTNSGKVRILKDVNNKAMEKGLPSQPVRIVGFKTPPKAGDPLVCVASEQIADDLVERRIALQTKHQGDTDGKSNFSQVIISGRESMTTTGVERRLERYDLNLEDTGPIRIPIIVKAKADGSVVAVRDSLQALGKESKFDLNIDPIAEGVGPLTKSEVEMAKESSAVVFCFDVKNNDKAVVAMAEAENVPVHAYNVIYSLLDGAKDVFTEYLPSVAAETVHGRANVQAVFSINGGKDSIAGLNVSEGYLHKSMVETNDKQKLPVHFRVLRNGERISPTSEKLTAVSLKHFKDDVDKVRHGEECGLGLSGYTDFQEGDVIECYSVEMKKSFA